MSVHCVASLIAVSLFIYNVHVHVHCIQIKCILYIALTSSEVDPFACVMVRFLLTGGLVGIPDGLGMLEAPSGLVWNQMACTF